MSERITITLGFTRYNDVGIVTESYENEFNHNEDEESYYQIMDKFKNLLVALGYELDGSDIGLVEQQPSYETTEDMLTPSNNIIAFKSDKEEF